MTNQLSSSSLTTLALVLNNAGGEGKSTFAEMLAAMARLAGLNTIVTDVDPGNRGYLNRNGDDSAQSLEWSVSDDPVKWYDQNLANSQFAILDTGANMLAAGSSINEFTGKLIALAIDRGVKVIIFGVMSPNKPGSADLIELMYKRFHKSVEVVVVQNDRDGSKAFPESLSLLGTQIISLPHIVPALQAVRLRRSLPLDQVLCNPEFDYERATALIASHLADVAGQDAVIDVVGNLAKRELESLSANAPQRLFYHITNVKYATNAAVNANEKMRETWVAFHATSKDDTPAFLRSAEALWDAERVWTGFLR